MSNNSKDKGTAAETAVIKLMKSMGWYRMERRALQGKKDRGDLAGMHGVVIEVKAEKDRHMKAAMEQTLIEAENDGGSVPILVYKIPYKNVKQWDAYIPLRWLLGDNAALLRSASGHSWCRLDLEDMLYYLKDMGY